jgi:hypothetical protein
MIYSKSPSYSPGPSAVILTAQIVASISIIAFNAWVVNTLVRPRADVEGVSSFLHQVTIWPFPSSWARFLLRG